MKILNGIRGTAFAVLFFSAIAALFYKEGMQQDPYGLLYDRWLTYQTNCLWVIGIALMVIVVLSVTIWFVDGFRKEVCRQRELIVEQTKQRVHLEGNESDRRREHNANQLGERWAREIGQRQN